VRGFISSTFQRKLQPTTPSNPKQVQSSRASVTAATAERAKKKAAAAGQAGVPAGQKIQQARNAARAQERRPRSEKVPFHSSVSVDSWCVQMYIFRFPPRIMSNGSLVVKLRKVQQKRQDWKNRYCASEHRSELLAVSG